MTTLLRKAIGRLTSLPARDQDLYARQLIAELDSGKRWDELFDLTTDEQVDKMIEKAKRDVAENGTISLAELKARL